MPASRHSRNYANSRSAKPEYQWYGGVRSGQISVPTDTDNEGGWNAQLLRAQPRIALSLPTSTAHVEPVAFPSGITRGRDSTIRRFCADFVIYDKDFRQQPGAILWAMGIIRIPVADQFIADADNTTQFTTISPLKEYRDSWMIHQQGVWVATRPVSSYTPFSAQADIDTENMRKFGPQDGCFLIVAAKAINADLQSILTVNFSLAWRALISLSD